MGFRHRKSRPDSNAPPSEPRSIFATGDETAQLRERVTALEQELQRLTAIITRLQLQLEQSKPAPEDQSP